MRSTTVVLLGAGASADSAAPGIPIRDGAWRPPLASQLFQFSKRPNFHAIARAYPRLSLISSEIARAVDARGESLERVLSQYALDPNGEIREAYASVPLYLCDLLSRCGAEFLEEPSVHILLARKLILDHERNTTFVSLNYDCTLESALQVFGFAPSRLEDYLTERLSVVKPHGSVSWSVPVPAPNGIESALASLDLGALRTRPVSVDHGHCVPGGSGGYTVNKRFQMRGSGVMDFPIITVPLVDKTEDSWVCPDAHREHLRASLARCSELLVIGSSCGDEHILRHVEANLAKAARVYFVGPPESADAAARLRRAVGAAPFSHVTAKFSEFVYSDAIKSCLSS